MNESQIFKTSMEIAQTILEKSYHLSAVDASVKENYRLRDRYLRDLLGAEMFVSFHPEVKATLRPTFIKLIDRARSERYVGYRPNWMEADPDHDQKYKEFNILDRLIDFVDDEHLLSNTLPEYVKQYIDDYNLKDYKSPKLSKLLVKILGEQHDAVKWYTNKCPKTLTVGVREDYKIVLSILPHHIAGMSYYAPKNHGGSSWMEGYNGTSCMDPVQNSEGVNIYSLPAALRDEFTAVAFLASSEEFNPSEPIYEARALIRLVHVHGKPQMFICRPYYLTNEHKHILTDGLKNHFDNMHFFQEIDSKYNIYSDRDELFEQDYEESVMFEINRKPSECSACDGTGKDQEDSDWDCEECGGSGVQEFETDHLPYVDDDDFVDIHYTGRSVSVRLPSEFLKDKGLLDEEEAEEDNEDDDDREQRSLIDRVQRFLRVG